MKRILFSTGEVTSPNYPNNYPNFLEKTQTIRVEEGLILSLLFTAFDIDTCSNCDSSCRSDHLTITDGDGTTLMEKSCGSLSIGDYVVIVGGQSIGSSLPAAITSTSNIVKLVFITNRQHTRSGWSVSWIAVTPGECQQCNLTKIKNTRCFQSKQTRPLFPLLNLLSMFMLFHTISWVIPGI